MSSNRTECPYCGELVAVGARKCRFCGEWLDEDSAPETQSQIPVVQTAEPVEVATLQENYAPMQPGQGPQYIQLADGRVVPVAQQPTTVNGPVSTAPQIIIAPQMSQTTEQVVDQTVENTVIINKSSSSEDSGLLWAQVVAVGIGVGVATASFWYGVAAAIILGICCFIPYIGAGLCVVLGLASGAIIGIIAAAFGAPAWVAWMIGILGAFGLVIANLHDGEHISIDD